jgi:hypothetical protein
MRSRQTHNWDCETLAFAGAGTMAHLYVAVQQKILLWMKRHPIFRRLCGPAWEKRGGIEPKPARRRCPAGSTALRAQFLLPK